VKFESLPIQGAYTISLEPHSDDRGFFARTWCKHEFEQLGLCADIAQCGISVNVRKGTLRGMHLQAPPHEETKVVRCVKGAIFDVVLDLRRDSPTFLAWHGVELSASNRLAVYIPAGCAHGFQTLDDDCEVGYQISEFYHPECSRSVRWNDSAFAIRWPLPVTVISDADRGHPDFVR
jgi:dTDP-4-dehydrorhamnose 3,5-epimerase